MVQVFSSARNSHKPARVSAITEIINRTDDGDHDDGRINPFGGFFGDLVRVLHGCLPTSWRNIRTKHSTERPKILQHRAMALVGAYAQAHHDRTRAGQSVSGGDAKALQRCLVWMGGAEAMRKQP